MSTGKTWPRSVLWGVGAALLGFLVIACVIPLVLVLVVPPPKAYIWLLPDGYVGWVRVDFGVPEAPSLPEEEGYRVIRVPDGGVVATRDALITSPSRERYFYEKDGVRRPAPSNIAGWTSQEFASAERGRDDLSLFAFFGTVDDHRRSDPAPGAAPVPGNRATGTAAAPP